MPPLDLSAGVDVYSDWIDACDAVAKDAAGKPGHREAGGSQTVGSPDPAGRAVIASTDVEETDRAYADEY